MAENMLKVKFSWKLRSQSKSKEAPANVDKTQNVDTTCKKLVVGKSKSATYMRTVKDNNPDKYNRYLVKDAKRKRVSYVSIKDKSQAEQKEQRNKWAENKRNQRKQKKVKTASGSLPENTSNQKKRYKDMNKEERKEYHRQKMELTRGRMSKQKKTANKTEKESCSNPRA